MTLRLAYLCVALMLLAPIAPDIGIAIGIALLVLVGIYHVALALRPRT
jgi:hypothetical protein